MTTWGAGASLVCELVEEVGLGGAVPEVVVIPVVTEDGALRAAPGVPAVVGGVDVAAAVESGTRPALAFTGKAGASVLLGGEPTVALVGCGAQIEGDGFRKLGAGAVRAAGKAGTVLLAVPGADRDAGRAVVEGAVLAAYRFDTYRSEPGHGPERLLLLGEGEGFGDGVAEGRVTAAATVFARDLVNTGPSDMTPRRLAELAGTELGVEVEVWDEEQIRAERLGGVLGVARGSEEPPRLVIARHRPKGASLNVVLVGKGITFDSGGLSLKGASGMMTMKTDMSGAAAVLSAIGACVRLELGVRVTAIAPLTENMPGGGAQKPGDVLRARNGKTIEVLNTDAEGRLVLADALSLAAEEAPDVIVDVATLTGACVAALGNRIAGCFTNDEALGERVRAAGERAGERLWPLPMPEDYRSDIDSDVADMKNIGKDGQAGAIAAAMLLAEFVGDVPWAHLDIAGPARSAESSGYVTKGGTGFATRTLVELVRSFAEAG